MSAFVWIGVVLVSGAGSVLRFVVDRAVASRFAWPFPLGTLTVNLTGAAVLGLVTGLALGRDAALLAGIAAVGSYATFRPRRPMSWLASRSVSPPPGRSVDWRTPVNEDCLKLTSYFGERQRSGDRFLAEAMLDLFGEREIASSILLRGVAGFGLRHHLRTDQTLSMSEDPPVAVIAVDTKTRIDELLEPMLAMKKRGLVTLERARLLRHDIGPIGLSDELDEVTKLTIYVGRKERVYGIPAYIALCDLLYRRQLAGASVFLGVDGTAHGQRERARFFDRNVDVPVMIIAVGSGEQIGRVLPELGGLIRRPLITVERVRVCKRDGELLERPHALPGTDEHGLGLWQKLMVYTSESAHHGGQPIHRALTRELRQRKSSRGATVLRGIWGFHGHHEPHGDKLFQLARHVPVVTIVIDTPANIAESFDVIDEFTNEKGLVTSEMVSALVSVDSDDHHGGTDMSRHPY
jgi:PII-like signaling protein